MNDSPEQEKPVVKPEENNDNINSLPNTGNMFGNTSLLIGAFSMLGSGIYLLKKRN